MNRRVAILLGLIVLFPARTVLAQSSDAARQFFERFTGRSFANPQEMFEQFLGGDSEEQQAALEEIDVSLEEEREYGSQAADAYLEYLRQQQIPLTERGRDVRYLQALVETLRPLMEHGDRYERMRIVIARNDLTDARSFPGGTLIFFAGMLDFADNEAALIGVVGHELSHLDRGHQLLPIKRTKLARNAFSGASGQGDGRSFARMLRAGTTLVDLWSHPFRPEDETQADLDAANWLYEAGYDPRQLARLFLRLQERSDSSSSVGQMIPSFLRTHPYHRERYESVLREYDRLQREDPQPDLYIGVENLRRRTPRSKQEFE
jgi:predicted Zn-dependent protease